METSDASAVADQRLRDLAHMSLTREDRANLFRYMVMMRDCEERALTLYKQGKVPGSFYDGRGQEAISVGAAFVLGPRDRMCILHRDRRSRSGGKWPGWWRSHRPARTKGGQRWSRATRALSPISAYAISPTRP